MNQILYNTHTFSQGALQIHFYFDDFAGQGCILHDVSFYEFDPSTDEYVPIAENGDYENGDFRRFTDGSQQYDVYINVGKNRNHLVKARAYVTVDPTELRAENLPCCVERERVDGVDYWVFTFHFVDLSAMQSALLKRMNLTCEDDCRVPVDVVNCILHMFSIYMAADTNDGSLEQIFTRFTSHKNTNYKSSGCNCNG